MRVYRQAWFDVASGRQERPYRPLTDISSDELRDSIEWYERGAAVGAAESGAEAQSDIADQIRIILFAREMGWL